MRSLVLWTVLGAVAVGLGRVLADALGIDGFPWEVLFAVALGVAVGVALRAVVAFRARRPAAAGPRT